MARLRRKNILKSVNPDIADLAKEDIAPPNILGSGFESKMKERVESVKVLSASGPVNPRAGSFFRRAVPLPPKEAAASRTEGDLPGPRGTRNLQPESDLPESVSRERLSNNLILLFTKNLINMTLVQKGVVPLKVDKSIVAGRLTFFKDNWDKLSQDQWILNTIRGYKIESVSNPSQGRRSRVAILPKSQ